MELTEEQRQIIPEEYRNNKLSKMPMYSTLRGMRYRCNNPNCKDYKNYGGKGIRVCKRWSNDSWAFVLWAFANGYKKGLSIDRIDPKGNYSPNNCRWITISENAKRVKRPRKIEEINLEGNYIDEDFVTGIDTYNALYLINYCIDNQEPITPVYSYEISDFNKFPKSYYKYLADYDMETNSFNTLL